MAVAVQGREDIANIAAISANDPEIGRLIADVMDRVGKDGVITVEESRGLSSLRLTMWKGWSSTAATSPPTS